MTRVALTIGDPAGIGPELILKIAPEIPGDIDLTVYGSRAVLEWTAAQIPGIPKFSGRVKEALSSPGAQAFGTASRFGAELQYRAFEQAVESAKQGEVDAVVTAPWTKHMQRLIGLPPSGHTELLGRWCDVEAPLMVLAGDRLRVALATTHIPLSEVPMVLDEALVVDRLERLVRGLQQDFSIARPRIAVCGLNPHAGESGCMGTEDQRIIGPAIEKARAAGLEVEGPFPADTLFPQVVRSTRFDAVLAMFHDQGLIPLKLWHFGESANITFGLPIVRTSVDHGTAYDIAGKGIADPGSLSYAIKMAAKIVAARKRSEG